MATHFKQLDYPEDIEDLAYDPEIEVEKEVMQTPKKFAGYGLSVIGTLRVSTQRLLADYEGVLFYYRR